MIRAPRPASEREPRPQVADRQALGRPTLKRPGRVIWGSLATHPQRAHADSLANHRFGTRRSKAHAHDAEADPTNQHAPSTRYL